MKTFNLFKAFGIFLKVVAFITACFAIMHGYSWLQSLQTATADQTISFVVSMAIVVSIAFCFLYLLFWYMEEDMDIQQPVMQREADPNSKIDYNDKVRIERLQAKGYRIYEPAAERTGNS